MSAHFVDGWTIAQVLGEGAFGEVRDVKYFKITYKLHWSIL